MSIWKKADDWRRWQEADLLEFYLNTATMAARRTASSKPINFWSLACLVIGRETKIKLFCIIRISAMPWIHIQEHIQINTSCKEQVLLMCLIVMAVQYRVAFSHKKEENHTSRLPKDVCYARQELIEGPLCDIRYNPCSYPRLELLGSTLYQFLRPLYQFQKAVTPSMVLFPNWVLYMCVGWHWPWYQRQRGKLKAEVQVWLKTLAKGPLPAAKWTYLSKKTAH